MYDIISKVKNVNQAIENMPGIENENTKQKSSIFSDLVHDEGLKRAVEQLFNDGHYAQAVEEAYKFLNNLVKGTSQLDTDADGSKLMKQVFSPNNPILMINSGSSRSENDEQLGYMEIFSGCMTGIRNPRAHESEWQDTWLSAIQLIAFADHLVKKVRNSIKNNETMDNIK